MTDPRDSTSTADALVVSIDARPPRRARSWALQLVLLPLALVGLLGALAVCVIWWWHADYDAHSLVRDLRTAHGYDWPKAYALSQFFRSPAHDSLKDDAGLCRALTSLLADELRRPQADPEQRQFQAFLCRAVGEFRVPHGIPVLLDAVTAHRDPDSLPVRIAAFESLAVLAGQLESQVFSRDPRAVALLLDATHMTDATTTDRATIRAAATATFALGIVGGPVALHRLRELLTDARADLRDNAATGLARHGVADGIPVLVAMLDAAADAHVASATDQFAQEAQWRRIRTAARAARQLARANTDADLRPVLAALHRVAGDASTPADVQQEVAAAQRELQSALPTR